VCWSDGEDHLAHRLTHLHARITWSFACNDRRKRIE
jgi:hypothetical protein